LTQINGEGFPDHALALTWDDGPDAFTLPLAAYLAHQKIAATFFVVGAWVEGVSSDPGEGRGVYATGHELMPVLGELVHLGHRLGNHTLNHVLLSEVPEEEAAYELRENQERIDPYLTNELRIFRAPGGAWTEGAARAVGGDEGLAAIVGPIRWDVDRKDWDGSLTCASDRPALECERAPGVPGRMQVKPAVMAERYLHSIEQAHRGIVLMHDRVGNVGSTYALELAEALVPMLKARAYVFAPPVLRFGALAHRTSWGARSADGGAAPSAGAIALVDVDGDGRADLCRQGDHGVLCARSITLPAEQADGLPRMAFAEPEPASVVPPPPTPAAEADVWTAEADVDARTALAGDLNGDGRNDVCAIRKGDEGGVVCALAAPHGFLRATVWLPHSPQQSVALGDVNGDGRADLCEATNEGVACALAP
jgi:peptidoglycan/xylan/chitin deacetylase (PgdA/CDA1 family)